MLEKEHINPAVPPLHLLCGNDDLRPVFSYILCRNGMLVATDAHLLAHCPVDYVFGKELGGKLEGKLIPGAAFKAICEAQRKKTLHDVYFVEGTNEGLLFVILRNKFYKTWLEFSLTNDGTAHTFPQWEIIWNEIVAKEPTASRFGINPEYLKRLSKVLLSGSEKKHIELDFRHHNTGVLAGVEDGKIFGLIMPTMVSQPEQRITQIFKTKQS